MTVLKSLPAQPSLESLRKQAKKLARDIAAGDAAAIARARAHLQNAGPPLTQRNTRLVIAREYGFAGWRDLRRGRQTPRQRFSLRRNPSATCHSRQRCRTPETAACRLSDAAFVASRQERPRRARNGNERLCPRCGAERGARAGFHARRVRRAAHRSGRGRGSVGLRRHPRIAHSRLAGAVSAEGPPSAHARVLCGARQHRRRAHRARREWRRCGGRQRSVRARQPFRS
jgi:hypothetical protein